MTNSGWLLATVVGLAIPMFGAYWVWQDAHRLKKNGANVNPGLWTVFVFLLWLVSLPCYLYLRRTFWRVAMSPPLGIEMPPQNVAQDQLLNLSSHENRVLSSVVHTDPSETVGQFVKRKGSRGILWLVMMVSLGIAAPIAIALWRGGSLEQGDVLLLLLLLFILRVPEDLAKDRLIRKLYYALEVKSRPGSLEGRPG